MGLLGEMARGYCVVRPIYEGGNQVILFKQEHVEPILVDRKTQTRRTGMLRWKVGAVRQAKTGYNKDSEFAKLKIISVRQERLGLITLADAYAEGYDSIEEYKEVFIRIYGSWDAELLVWVIDFRREEPECQT